MPPLHFPFFYPQNYYNKYPHFRSPKSADTNVSNSNLCQSNYKQYNNFNTRCNSNGSHYHFAKLNTVPNNVSKRQNEKNESEKRSSIQHSKKNNSTDNNDNYFFELFGLKLYFDDILLICLIFFLYQEGVHDDELFISLILLLLS